MKIFKTPIILIIAFLVSFQGIKAQEEADVPKYYDKMKSSLYTLYKAGNFETFNMVSKQLRKIADEEDTKWIPYYHTSYAYIMGAFLAKEKFTAEELLNQAQITLDKANKLSPNNNEVTALQGFLYQARIGINPNSRAHEYAQKAVQSYDMARFQNPENPRPYYLIGQILHRLPASLGGNKENACKHFQKASEKYETFKPRGEFSPNWGQAGNENMLNKCK